MRPEDAITAVRAHLARHGYTIYDTTRWLRNPNPRLDGAVPRDLILQGHWKRVIAEARQTRNINGSAQ